MSGVFTPEGANIRSPHNKSKVGYPTFKIDTVASGVLQHLCRL
jgi:hypothetical protein